MELGPGPGASVSVTAAVLLSSGWRPGLSGGGGGDGGDGVDSDSSGVKERDEMRGILESYFHSQDVEMVSISCTRLVTVISTQQLTFRLLSGFGLWILLCFWLWFWLLSGSLLLLLHLLLLLRAGS